MPFLAAKIGTETGSLEDFMFRKYSPGQGRWISPDPAGLAAVDMTNPQTWNRYAYVGNNPLSFTDPLGLLLDGPGQCSIGGDSCFGGGSPTGGWWFVNIEPTELGGFYGAAFYFGNDGCTNYVMTNCGAPSPCLVPFACGGDANRELQNPQRPPSTVKPLSAWDKAGMVLACIAGMDPEYAMPPTMPSDAQPSDSTDSTNTTEGQGPPMGPNKRGGSVPYGKSPEVPGNVAGGVAYGSGVAQCITNVFTTWPK